MILSSNKMTTKVRNTVTKLRSGSLGQQSMVISQFLFVVLIVTPSLFQEILAQNCGSQGGGAVCQSGYCCSIYGYCGTTNAYCGSGNCQSQCPSSGSPTGACGSNGGGVCQSGYCCSKYGYCGNTNDYCGVGNCQSQCPGSGSPPPPPPPSTPPSSGVGSIITAVVYNQIFPNRNSFYTYSSFISATNAFPSFGTQGNSVQRKRDIAAFFAHISHETSGLVYISEIDQSNSYCSSSPQYPCAAGKKYYGRGPLQISWNYNYGQCGNAIGQNLLANPDLVAQDATISWKTALWFWLTVQNPKPDCHSVMDGIWVPTSADIAAGRLPGFGVTILIINGGVECGPGASNPSGATDRMNFYQSICGTLGVDPGLNLACSNMQPF